MFRRTFSHSFAAASRLALGQKVHPSAQQTPKQQQVVTPTSGADLTPKTSSTVAAGSTAAFISKSPVNAFDHIGDVLGSLNAVHDDQIKSATAAAAARADPEPSVLAPNKTKNNNLASAFQGHKISRFFRFEQAYMEMKPGADFLFSSEESSRVYTFNVAQNPDTHALAASFLKLPLQLRRFHAVIGNEKVPCDWFGDIDLNKNIAIDPEQLVSDVIETALAELKSVGLSDCQVLLLQSPNELKHSFHLHIRSSKGALKDFSHARTVAMNINEKLSKKYAEDGVEGLTSPLDSAIYRKCGQMRMAYCAKHAKPDSFLDVYRTPKLPALKKQLEYSMGLTPAQAMEMSFCVRVGSAAEKLKVFGCKNAAVEFEKNGFRISPELKECFKEQRFEDALKQLKKCPPEFARLYKTWNNVGCALFSFGPEYWERGLDAWLAFSRTAGDNFDPQACKNRFNKAYRGGHKGTAVELNWRRGYRYIMFTIWGRSKQKSLTAGKKK